MPELSDAKLGEIADELRRRAGLEFVLVWKEEGEREICIRHSSDLTRAGAVERLQSLLEDLQELE